MRNEFAKHLTEAKQAADAIAFAKAPKVDPVKAERFEKRLRSRPSKSRRCIRKPRKRWILSSLRIA
ncbi:Uncharacterised protein [Mycobacteroides abscessus subsp. abscessus]|nr:Uncharacterised protein [Mycobacteroides abscessus subsp. abscessus]